MSCLLDAALDGTIYPSPGNSCPCQTFSLDGVQCLYQPNKGPGNRFVVYLHGNVMTLATLHQSGIIPALSNICDAHVVVPEYPGYGDHRSMHRGRGQVADRLMFSHVHKVVDCLRARGIQNITMMGRSIGTGIVLGALATQQGSAHAVRNVVLVSPFTCIADLAPWGTQWAVPRRLDNAANIQTLPQHVRTVIIHGTEDNFVPFYQGRQLSTLRKNCTFVPIPGMAHAIDAVQFAKVARAARAFMGPAPQAQHAESYRFDIFKP